MKKQLKTTVMAIALLATVTGAVAAEIATAFSGKNPAVYHWIRKTRAGTIIPGSQVTGDESNPYPAQCPGEVSTVCAEGTLDGQSSPSLFYYYD